MKKYVCPMGCLPAGKAGVEPQDQPGNCSECGMKLLPVDEDPPGLKPDTIPGFKPDISGDYPGNNAKMIYFIEGHIPIEAIEKLLTEKPEIDGIALPEMPSGSPGMPGFKLAPFKIHSVKNGQDQGIYIEI
jgi:hypothetical protein